MKTFENREDFLALPPRVSDVETPDGTIHVRALPIVEYFRLVPRWQEAPGDVSAEVFAAGVCNAAGDRIFTDEDAAFIGSRFTPATVLPVTTAIIALNNLAVATEDLAKKSPPTPASDSASGSPSPSVEA